MYEEFSERGKAVCESTAGIAISLGHNYVGTEHLLLALLDAEERAGDGPLLARGVTRASVTEQALAWLSRIVSGEGGGAMTLTDIPFTARAYKVLHLAVGIAATKPAEPRHILQAILEEDGGLGVVVLDKLGVDLVALRSDLEG